MQAYGLMGWRVGYLALPRRAAGSQAGTPQGSTLKSQMLKAQVGITGLWCCWCHSEHPLGASPGNNLIKVCSMAQRCYLGDLYARACAYCCISVA